MGIDITKLTSDEFNEKIDRQAVEEKLNEIPEGLIHFSKNPIFNYCISKKVGLKDEPSPRVLANWANKGLVKTAKEDKGRIKRFDKLESVWLNILVELRGFGLPLDSLNRTRKILFDYVVSDFSLLKFHFLNSILRKPQTLVVYKNGDARITATETYLKIYKKHKPLPHLSLDLADFIKPEYNNPSFDENFNINNPFENQEKLKLLYFLKTGDYEYMKVKLSDGDIRYIENASMALKSIDVLTAFSNWSFDEVIISIDDEAETIITAKKR